MFLFSIVPIATTFFILSCKKDDDTIATATTTTTLTSIFTKFNATVIIAVFGNFVVLTTNEIPDHKSPY